MKTITSLLIFLCVILLGNAIVLNHQQFQERQQQERIEKQLRQMNERLSVLPHPDFHL